MDAGSRVLCSGPDPLQALAGVGGGVWGHSDFAANEG